MDLVEFQDLLDRYGDDMGRWSPERRRAAEEFLTASPEARAALERARDMARLFAARPRVTAPADLTARILARALPDEPPPPPPGGGWRMLLPDLASLGRWARGAFAARPVGVALGLAACFALGFTLGQGLSGASREAAAVRADGNLFAPIVR
jgi:anti-sigma factor RsiW